MEPLWATHLGTGNERYDSSYYENPREEVLPSLKGVPGIVLDVGCGGGATGRLIRNRFPGCRLLGIELNPKAATVARGVYDRVVCGSVSDPDTLESATGPERPDTVLLLDVLEHIVDPWNFLARLRPRVSPDAQIIASIPNAFSIWMLDHLASGQWTYEANGLLDITHLRFFTLNTIADLFRETGYSVVNTRCIPYPADRLPAVISRPEAKSLETAHVTIKNLTDEKLRELYCGQFLVRARPGLNVVEEDPGEPAENDRRLMSAPRRTAPVSDDTGSTARPPAEKPAPSAHAITRPDEDPNSFDPEAIILRAIEHERSGNFAEAERLYTRVLKLRPDHAFALHYMGVLRWKTGALSAAEELMRRSIEHSPDTPHFYRNLAVCLHALGKYDQAILAFRTVQQLQPDDLTVSRRIARIEMDQALLVAGNDTLARQALRNVTNYCAIRGISRLDLRVSPQPVQIILSQEALPGSSSSQDRNGPGERVIGELIRDCETWIDPEALEVRHTGIGCREIDFPGGHYPRGGSLLFVGEFRALGEWYQAERFTRTILLWQNESPDGLLQTLRCLTREGRTPIEVCLARPELAGLFDVPGFPVEALEIVSA